MGNGDSSNCYAASHVTVGEVHGIFDISVFQEISQFFYRHHRAVLLGFLRGSAQVGRNKDSLAACHDGIGEVCYVFLYLAAFQRVDQRFLVYQKISGEVKKNHTVLHFRESVSVDHLPGAVQQRNMDRNIIALAVDLIQGFAVFDRSGKIPCGVDGEIGIVSVNFHSQMGSGIGYKRADCSQSDDTQLLAADLAAGELFFLFLRQLVDVFFILLLSDPLDPAYDITGCKKHSGKHQFLYAVGVGSRCVEHYDTLLRVIVHRNIVYACACAGNSHNRIGNLHVMHFRASDKDSVRVVRCVCFFIIIAEHI